MLLIPTYFKKYLLINFPNKNKKKDNLFFRKKKKKAFKDMFF